MNTFILFCSAKVKRFCSFIKQNVTKYVFYGVILI